MDEKDRARLAKQVPGQRSVIDCERPAGDPHGPEDLAATMYHLLGIDPNEEFYTPEGRPVKIVNNGRVIHGLL